MKITPYDLSLQRPTWAEINLDTLYSNYLTTRKIAPSSEILAVVKSDAYGHGSEVISKELSLMGVQFFGTATAMEGIELRRIGIESSIILLSGIVPSQISLPFDFDLTPTVHHIHFFQALQEEAERRKKQVKIHLKVDTGMGRLGMTPENALSILTNPHPYIQIEGLFTHLANADLPEDPYTRMQLQRFRNFVDAYTSGIPYLHAANSAAVLNYPDSHFNMIRPGILLYGGSPVTEKIDGLQPILSLKSKIIALRSLPKGERIGYGLNFRAEQDSVIATVPFGYADGLRRALSNRLKVEVCGAMCSIAGNISMDLCMIDVTDISDRVQLEDTVTFLGPQNSAWHWADLLGTVPYEITCLIGARVPRVYYKNHEIYDVYYP